MTISEYQKEAKRTCNDLGSPESNMMHMVAGAATELGEVLDLFKKELAYGKKLDLLELKLESGDIIYYLVNAITFLGHEDALNDGMYKLVDMELFPEFDKNSPTDCCGLVVGLLGSFVDTMAEGDHYSGSVFTYYLLQVKNLLEAFDIDFGETLQTNIDKLRARYPEKFTAEKALNRDLDKEYEAIK